MIANGKPWVARGWTGVSVKRIAWEKRYAESWHAADALTVLAQNGARFDQVTIDYEPEVIAYGNLEQTARGMEQATSTVDRDRAGC